MTSNYALCKIIILMLMISFSSSQPCHEEYDIDTCVYNVFCTDSRYELQRQRDEYTHQRISNELMRHTYSTCENGILIDNNNYYVQPVHLTYKKNKNYIESSVVPSKCYDWVCQAITSLNLSSNNYHNMPTIQPLENLRLLNISQNYISMAVLSNIHELSSLDVIVFSHNTINNLSVNVGENPFINLKTIDLSYNYIVILEDAILKPFEKLQYLDLSHNAIDSLTQLTFEGLMNLMYLNISHNRISEINSSLFRFNNLKTLKLNDNKLRDIKCRDFEILTKIEYLDLSSNLIHDIDKEVFQNMPLLYSLDLSNNLIEFFDKKLFTKMIKLTSINISDNKFKQLPVSLFRGRQISSFDIQGNHLEGCLMKGIFEGLSLVKEIDLSFQYLSALDDLAFIGLAELDTLLLNNNNLNGLPKNSFKQLYKLRYLDLSHNKIVSIDFDKDDLHNLQSLSLRNNYLAAINSQHFKGLNFLQFLDLSNNNISTLEANSFTSLRELINFEISNNPLSGTLEENTFDGLNSLPNLDISCSLLIAVQNNSFSGMNQLKKLNMSHSKVRELHYNAFLHTGSIQVMDISYNELDTFYLNTTELTKLETLLLNNNLITSVSYNTFHKMKNILKISLANNNINQIENDALADQKDIHYIDLSHNVRLKFNVSLIKSMNALRTLNVSEIERSFTFRNVGKVSLSTLQITYLEIIDLKTLQLSELAHIENLIIRNNNLTKIEVGSFSNMTKLSNLDLSWNKISSIQPGAFKENTFLYSLNISHNSLSTLSYGIFRGLVYLNTLDISYNKINDLESERFYEVTSLNVIIADYNMISSIKAEDFIGTHLKTLSIGGNPLPCKDLSSLKKFSTPFEITALNLDETSYDENIYGVTCNMDHFVNKYRPEPSKTFTENDKVLLDIRDILLSYAGRQGENSNEIIKANNDAQAINDLNQNINTIAKYINNKTSSLTNMVSNVVKENSNTNILLEKILKAVTLNQIRKTSIPIVVQNTSNDNFVPYVYNIRKYLENTIALEKQDLINDIEKKVSLINSRIDSLSTEKPKHEKFVSSDIPIQSKSFFTETCVALILVILVCTLLYKFYKSRVYIRNRLSLSTRELPSAIEN